MNLKNKKILITGATGGIGKCLIEKFYNLESNIVATGTNEEKLNKLKNKYPKIIKEVRGKGLLVGLCLKVNQNNFIQKLTENNLLTVRASENVVRLLPPLNVTKREISIAIKIIEKVCKKYR